MYLVVTQLAINAVVPYTAVKARIVLGSMPKDLYKMAGEKLARKGAI